MNAIGDAVRGLVKSLVEKLHSRLPGSQIPLEASEIIWRLRAALPLTNPASYTGYLEIKRCFG